MKPTISPRLLRWFSWYAHRYVRRHFHVVRVARADRPVVDFATPLIVYGNHASWWDPLIGLVLAARLFPDRALYAPIEAAMLERYRFFGRLGFFGVEVGTRAGAAEFLRTGAELLGESGAMIWLTPQGRFADARERPVALRSGMAHLAARCPAAMLLPIAVEYVFWEEKTPEVLVRCGRVIRAEGKTARELGGKLEAGLGAAQDALAESAMARDAAAFETVLGGRAGVGGFYDVWQRLRARMRGAEYRVEHGTR